MNTVDLGDLMLRMIVSLAIVLALMYVAYRVLKRRQGGAVPSSARTPRPARASRTARGSGRRALTAALGAAGGRRQTSRRGAPRAGVQVLGRQGLSRSSGVAAVQFAGRVLLIGTSEQATPVVLAEADLSAWNEATEPEPAAPTPVVSTPLLGDRPSMIEALREMTARRG